VTVEKKQYTLTFAGDTSLGDYYLGKPGREAILARLKNDPLSFFQGVRPLIDDSDYLIVNLETVLADNPPNPLAGKKYPNWDNPDRTIDVLKKIGVTAVSLANNHTMDFGPDLMLASRQKLRDAGIECFGAGSDLTEASRPLTIELKKGKNRKTIYILTGMFASKQYHEDYKFFADMEKPGVNTLNINHIVPQVRRLRKQNPGAIVIVCPHWQGVDYKQIPPQLENICQYFITAGADYVFAHGTHTIGRILKTGKGIIACSIGNFVFNSPGRYRKMQAPPYSLIVKLHITENQGQWHVAPCFYPIVSDNLRTGFQVRPVTKTKDGLR